MPDTATTVSALSAALGILSTAIAVVYSLFEWRKNLRDQQRRVSLESARLAWELANALHENPVVENALELLDGETTQIKTRRHGTHTVAPEDVFHALAEPSEQSEKAAAIRYCFDSMFYALDRLRAILSSELIERDDISSATLYYCIKLATTHKFALDYGSRYGYAKTVALIERLAAEANTYRNLPPNPQPDGTARTASRG